MIIPKPSSDFKQKVIEIVLQIPEGKVTTYGAVATMAGAPRAARIVGEILHYNSEKFNLPWQRVVNKDGFISIKGGWVNLKLEQKALLEEEGVAVSKDFMVNLDQFGWFGE